jgi:hypothetical protein
MILSLPICAGAITEAKKNRLTSWKTDPRTALAHQTGDRASARK